MAAPADAPQDGADLQAVQANAAPAALATIALCSGFRAGPPHRECRSLARRRASGSVRSSFVCVVLGRVSLVLTCDFYHTPALTDSLRSTGETPSLGRGATRSQTNPHGEMRFLKILM